MLVRQLPLLRYEVSVLFLVSVDVCFTASLMRSLDHQRDRLQKASLRNSRGNLGAFPMRRVSPTSLEQSGVNQDLDHDGCRSVYKSHSTDVVLCHRFCVILDGPHSLLIRTYFAALAPPAHVAGTDAYVFTLISIIIDINKIFSECTFTRFHYLKYPLIARSCDCSSHTRIEGDM